MTHPSIRNTLSGRTLRAGALAALMSLSLISCSDGVTGASDVVGGVWRLSSMRLAGATSSFVPEDPARFTVEFKADGTIGVRADCNSCGGSYALRGDQLSVPGMACTLALCATPQGGEFANLIEGVSTLDRDGDATLVLGSPDGTITLAR